MAKSSIEWTGQTWNPVTGCDKISSGCKFCYADVMAKRLKGMGQHNYRNGFKLTLQPHMLERPLKWKKPSLVFVNSMSDILHKDVPLPYIEKIFKVMKEASWHQFQVLTKRSEQLAEVAAKLNWCRNIWMGVTVESADYKFRIEHLRKTPAYIKFLSLEPLLGSLGELNLDGINWVIVGGESGKGPIRPMNPTWVREIRDQCLKQGVPFFFKQWGNLSNNPNPLDATAKQNGGSAKGGRVLDGRTWDEMPEVKNE